THWRALLNRAILTLGVTDWLAAGSSWCRRQPPGDPYNRRADKRTRREAIMDVYEAVRTRRSVRNFTDRPVPKEALERVLSAAAWAPSGSNIQPWHIYVVTGAALAEIRHRAGARVAAGDRWDEREYEMYRAHLKSPYSERKSAFGAQRYGALGIARGDLEARQRAASANWNFFGAPAALFCY